MATARLFKVADLPLIAIMALGLFLGTLPPVAEGSTAICANAESPCAEPYPAAPTRIEAEAVAPKFVTSRGAITCEMSTLSGDLASKSGTSIPIALTSMTFSECELEEKEETTYTCHIAPVSLGEFAIAGLKAYSGDATLSGTVLFISCGPLAKRCEYSGEPVLQVLSTTAEEAATFSISVESSLKAEGEEFCPEVSEWSAVYRVVSPETMYISSTEENSSLCAVEEIPCEAPNQYPSGSGAPFESRASELRFLAWYGSAVCKSVAFSGEFANTLAEPLRLDITAASFENCVFGGWSPCTVTTGLGQLEIAGYYGNALLNHVSLLVRCKEWFYTLWCLYEFNGEYSSPTFSALGKKEPLAWDAYEVELGKVAGIACPSSTTLDAQFSVTSPEAAYLSS